MFQYKDMSPDETLESRMAKAHAFLLDVEKGVRRQPMFTPAQDKALALFGINGCYGHPDPLLSDITAHIESSKLLHDIAGRYFAERIDEGFKTSHMTFVDDLGLTTDLAPTLRYAAFRRKVDKAIRAMGLHAIVFIEIQALTNYPQGGRGRTLMTNAHAICWGHVSREGIRAKIKKLNTSRSWSNLFDALPIKPRRLNGDEAQSIASYLTKVPYDAKYRKPVGSGKFRFRQTTKDYPTRLKIRILEGLSHFTLWDGVFGVNDGKHIRSELKTSLRDWHRDRLLREKVKREMDIAAFWARNQYGPEYRPYIIE